MSLPGFVRPGSIRRTLAVSALLTAFTLATPAFAADDPADLLGDFVHYAKIANVDLANGSGQALLDSGISNADLARLLDEGKVSLQRFEEAIARAQLNPDMEMISSELARRVEAGRLDMARDPKRIEEAIKMLVGVQRAKLIGKQRLEAAGEYAVPGLLRQITEGNDESLKLACDHQLRAIGRQAVTPLCIALPELSPLHQRLVCDILGEIRHPHAGPYLKELAAAANTPEQVRDAANRAARSCGVADQAVAALFGELSRQYFDEFESLFAFPGEPSNNIWAYDPFVGLVATPVPTVVYGEIMAMQTSSRALKHDAKYAPAISLFVASNLKRENELPQGATDPIYGDNKYTPDFYATVFGTQTCLDVLGLGIDKVNTPLVRDAINALSKTTGGSNLFLKGFGRQPLLEAMSYPDRRVQIESALTLGNALPKESFDGDHSVVPLLASTVRAGNKNFALVIVENSEDRSNAVNQLQALGFEIVGAGGTVNELQPDIARGVGVDLVLVRAGSRQTINDTIEALRRVPKAAAAPILALAPATDIPALKSDYRGDGRVIVTRAALAPEAMGAAVEDVMTSGAGGRITDAEAEEYAILALNTLRDIAISNTTVYKINDAESALIDAMDTRQGGTRLLVADILALIDSDPAQIKLFDAALAAPAEEQIDLLARVADSVKRYGDRAEERHVAALVDLVANSTGDVAEAAAAVHGALNLPSTDAVKLIP